MATSTIGTGGTFSSVQAWEDSLPATLTTPEVGQLKNQTHTVTAAITFSGITTSASNTVTLECEAGASFKDHASKATNPLRTSATYGALITSATNFVDILNVGISYLTIRGIQFRHTGSGFAYAISTGAVDNTTIQDCIFEVTSPDSAGLYIYGAASVVKNCAVILTGTGGDGIRLGQGPAAYHCTVVRTANQTAAGTAFTASFAAATAIDCASFNFTNPFTATSANWTVSTDYNATDQVSILTGRGTHNLESLVAGSQIENTGSTSANVDLRLKSGSALINAGVSAGGITTDIIGTTRSTPDIGAWEMASGPDVTAPTLSTLAVPTGGTTLTAILSESCTPSSGTGGFTLGGTSATVSSWVIAGGTALTLTLSGTVYSGQTVTLTYSRAATTDDIADTATSPNYLADFAAASVTNSSTQADPATLSNYTNFCCRSGGSNLNAGTRTGNAVVPGTSADFTYASGSWVASTRTFTLASGNPVTDGIAVGDFVSVYADGATATGYIARVTAVTATTIVTSNTSTAGSAPVDGTSNRTLKVGGAWLGPNAAIPWLGSFPSNSLVDVAGRPTRVNFRDDRIYAITSGISVNQFNAWNYQGFTTTYGDGGRAWIEGPTTGASFNVFNVASTPNLGFRFVNLGFRQNGATGTADLIVLNQHVTFEDLVVHTARGAGVKLSSGTNFRWTEGELYGCNTSNTANYAGLMSATGNFHLDRVVIRDNVGTNTSGVYTSGTVAASLDGCIFDGNGTNGGASFTSLGNVRVTRCDFFENVGPGLRTTSMMTIESSNFVKNGTYAIFSTDTLTVFIILRNCGFGSGSMVNASGVTNASIVESGSVTYASGVTPWAAPTTGDFTLILPAAISAGRGTFLQTTGGHTGTTSTVDIGAGQAASSGGGTSTYSRGRVVNHA